MSERFGLSRMSTVSAKSIIAKKRDGKELTSEEIQFWIKAGLLIVQIAPGFNEQ